ncbi:heme-binding protein [Geodermatophilus sp. DF01_2]|uniref:heme-binding protein n=1 Tax=Geodermatophilus sp. DF01-2 TaxID=2559610 RepID=UPI001FD79A8C|nr:heme-binding protein [Geodermatophilus sp. DF01_2]
MTRVVHRFGHSSLHVRQASIERGTTFEEELGLDPARYAAHGGAFPVVVRPVGPVGVVVSGLPQLADHRMVVAAIRAHLGR